MKSNKLVKFPSKDFDPSVYLVKKQEKLKSRTQSSVTDPNQDAVNIFVFSLFIYLFEFSNWQIQSPKVVMKIQD